MTVFYNEIDPFAAATLRNLIAAGHIAPGIVDERSIEDVRPDELAGYTQCHFFAGVGVWSLALRNAGWPDDRPVWTGSCPCQPFSAAGKGAGFADERHVWPAFHHLIAQCRPADIFGEQVAAKAVEPWIDLVHADLEAVGYAFGCIPFPSAGVGAPHIRDRAYWVANADGSNKLRISGSGRKGVSEGECGRRGIVETDGCMPFIRLDQTDHTGPQGHTGHDCAAGRQGPAGSVAATGVHGGLANLHGDGCAARGIVRPVCQESDPEHGRATCGLADDELQQRQDRQPGVCNVDDPLGRIEGAAAVAGFRSDMRPGPTNGHWADADWLFCRDGKWRPVMPGTFPLAHGAPARVGRLRAYGNAINAKAAQAFIESVMAAA